MNFVNHVTKQDDIPVNALVRITVTVGCFQSKHPHHSDETFWGSCFCKINGEPMLNIANWVSVVTDYLKGISLENFD